MRTQCLRVLLVIVFLVKYGFAFSFVNHADTEIRIDQAGGSMQAMPVLNQQDLADCYAYSAIQYWDTARYLKMADSKKFQTSTFQGASAEYAAIFSSSKKENNGDGDWNDGYAKPVLEYLNQRGGCSARFFRSKKTQQPSFLADFNSLYYGAYYPRVVQALDELAIAKTPLEVQAATERVKLTEDDYQKGKALLADTLLAVGHPLEMQILDDKLKHSRSVSDFTIETLQIGCKEDERIYFSTPVPAQVSIERLVYSGKDVLNEPEYDQFIKGFKLALERQFLQNKQRSLPMMIAYCSSFFRLGKSIKGVDKSELRCEPHESIITGIRYKDIQETDSFEVLIRNSRGIDCGGSLHSDFICESGSIWVPLSVMNNNLLNYYLTL